MLSKLHQQHGRNKNYLKPKSEMNQVFGLNHFAGVVFYNAKGGCHVAQHMSRLQCRLFFYENTTVFLCLE